jgi:hypothetical protein
MPGKQPENGKNKIIFEAGVPFCSRAKAAAASLSILECRPD